MWCVAELLCVFPSSYFTPCERAAQHGVEIIVLLYSSCLFFIRGSSLMGRAGDEMGDRRNCAEMHKERRTGGVITELCAPSLSRCSR